VASISTGYAAVTVTGVTFFVVLPLVPLFGHLRNVVEARRGELPVPDLRRRLLLDPLFGDVLHMILV
jgi:hypothetical protein